MKISRRARTWLIAIAAPLIFVIAFTIVVVSYAHFHTPPSVNVTTTSTTQIICAGSNQQCQSAVALSVLQSPPPQALLSPGVQIAPNEAKNVIFDTEGTYHLTSAMGNMNLTVTVDATD